MRNEERTIFILPPEEAKRIAAGEVVDRPSALVREFMDNAIDAGSGTIEVFIEEGGIKRTEVVDDGCGMGKEDLELCWITHATSKIRSLDDLQSSKTLGFRGEALAAAAAVSRLEVLSSRDGNEAWKLCAGPGEKGKNIPEQSRRVKGTSVRAIGLYDTIPARKHFLKRAGNEAVSCRQIFNEKALPFPEITFRFTQDGTLKSFLPPVSSLKARFGQVFKEARESAFMHEIAANGNGFFVDMVFGGPELSRGDRRLQFVFANNRRVNDYSLLQALEYGVQGWFPNGTHPMGAIFVTVDPALADFNIHPAKREVRFAESGAIHHAVSSALRDFCRRFDTVASLRSETAEDSAGFFERDFFEKSPLNFHGGKDRGFFNDRDNTMFKKSVCAGKLAMEALLSKPPDFAPLPGREASFTGHAAEENPSYQTEGNVRYIGQLFGLFLLVEKDDELFIIDQHAAHERILYDRFLSGEAAKQELLVAIPFSTESADDDSFLEEKNGELAKLGIVIRKTDGEWLIEALPPNWRLSDRETVDELLNLKNSGKNMAEHWAAGLSCRSAVKDGDYLDERTALALAEEAFALPVRRCPHGRPIWFELSKADLLKAVKRTK